jgi:L-asparaginase
MRRLAAVLVLIGCASLVAAAPSEKELPQVVVLATGGTIAGAAPSPTDPGYDPSKVSVDVLLEAVPELAKLARVRGEQIAQVASQDMTDVIWLKLAQRIGALLAKDDVAGVVVTHGTDTMEETAFFLHLVVRSEKPVVLTGAMRAGTSLSPDGPLNLFNAVGVAADPEARGRGVMLVMNDAVHGARRVTKSDSTGLGTFVSRNGGPLGRVYYGRARFHGRPTRRHTAASEFSVEGRKELPRVDIVYAHANLRGDLIAAAAKAGTKGIVLAGVGNGNASAGALDALATVAKEGVAVVRSSRVGSGIVLRNHEIDDDAFGFVAGDDLSPQKARILLNWR